MKKGFVFIIAVFTMGTAAQAQTATLLNKVNSAKAVAGATGFNVKSMTNSIVKENLVPKLGLSATQVPKVSSAVSSFLTQKEKILPLLQTNKAAYTSKQNALFGNLQSELGKTLVKQQMSQFLGLKSTATTGSALSYLFK